MGGAAESGLDDVPVPADYDGDGKADLAVYRRATGEWFVLRSSSGALLSVSWGVPESSGLGDRPVPADYDGDGRVDIGVYRKTTGEWFILRSSDGAQSYTVWGSGSSSGLGDTPVVGDYDADGRTDVAIYRTTTGEWFILFSSDGARPSGDGAHRRWAIDPCPRNTERSEEDTQSIAFGPTVGAIPATASPEGESGAAVLARGVQPPASPVRQRSVVARLKEGLSGQAEPASENRTVTAPEPPSAHPPFQEATGPLS